MQFVMKQLMGSGIGQTVTPTTDSASSAASSANMPGANSPIPDYSTRPGMNELESQYNQIPQTVAPMWPMDISLDISMYISSSLVMPSFRSMPSESLVLEEKDIRLGNWSDARDIHTSFAVPKEVQNNGTLWGHMYVANSGFPLDPTASHYDKSKSVHLVRPLTQYLPRKKVAKKRNLLGASKHNVTDMEEDLQVSGQPISSYYHPNFTLSLIPNSGNMSYVQLHPAVREWVHLDPTGARDASGQHGWYYPIVFLNTFWQLRTHMIELNSTVTRLPLNIHLNSLAHWKFSLLTTMDFGLKQTAQKAARGESVAGGDGSEFEEIKRILLDSNSYLLGTTIVVGILHTIFELLAFKSDVSHWRNKKDNVGVSVRTILANVFMQTIIFLYLIDNTEVTSWMILFGQGMGIVLEAWKITKTVDVRIRPTSADSTAFPWRYLPYTVVFEDKHKLSETEKKTQEYDEIAFKYMYYLAIPLLGAYAVYSLLYESHKSWYSFIITTLVGSVYAYGFLMMVPSLYINYRLGSVAHMPAKAMTYKFLK